MATTGEKLPTAAVTAAEDPWLDNDWTNPSNVCANDANTANITAASYDSPDQSYVLKASGFDFSGIPAGSTINGVTCRLNAYYRTSQGSGSVDLLQLLNTSGAKVGTNQCATPTALTTTTSTIITKGSASDQWGNTLTADWVKNAAFGVAIGIAATQANADVDINYVTLEIDYTAPLSFQGTGGLTGAAGSLTVSSSLVFPGGGALAALVASLAASGQRIAPQWAAIGRNCHRPTYRWSVKTIRKR